MTAPGKPATLRPHRKPQITGASDTDGDQYSDAAEAGVGRGPEQLAYGHETGHQSWPQPAPFAYLKVPVVSPW